MKRALLEMLAGMSVVAGVILIASSDPGWPTGWAHTIPLVAGSLVLSVGVQLAIYCGRAGRDR